VAPARLIDAEASRLGELPLLAVLALLAICLGAAIAAGSYVYWPIAAAAGLVICAALPVLARPMLVAAVLVLTTLLIDEFPNAVGETVERSARTAFYSKSLGLPGLYPPDLLLILALSLFTARTLLLRRPFRISLDPIGLSLLAMTACVLVSALASVLGGEPLREVVIETTTGLGFDVNQRGLQFIAAFQVKIFLMLPGAYLLGLMIVNEPKGVETLVRCFGLAMVGNMLMGMIRLATHPGLLTAGHPLFYDSPSTWVFALFIFHTLALWAWGALSQRQTLIRGTLALLLFVFIVISFRRTMWGACVLAAAFLLAMIPSQARARLLLAGFGVIAAVGALVLFTPLQDQLLAPVLSRVEQTSIKDASTLYRLAIFVYMAEHFSDIPLLGYGIEPLWNHVVALGYFRTNIENVHSLYFWWFLRTGWLGMVVALIGAATVLFQNWRVFRLLRDPQPKTLALCLFLAWLMLAFSGIFNPVYGQARYMLLAGLGLAVLSRLRTQVDR
jgi:O-antigen ligase